MNTLTFNDIAMPVSFYNETGVWGYMVNSDHKDFNAIEYFFHLFKKRSLFIHL